jgi:hypothetical protein
MSQSSLEVGNHFTHRHSGFSTVPRSLGAILKQQLGLEAEPRAPGPSPANVACYRFTEAGEQALTNWMRVHLECAFQVVEDGTRDLERQLIKELKPPLNLNGWSNPCRAWLRDLRKDCRTEANQARSA